VTSAAEEVVWRLSAVVVAVAAVRSNNFGLDDCNVPLT
jgi:hypothetical protein